MDQIARAGGTGEALHVLDGPNQAAGFAAALATVHESLARCDFALPQGVALQRINVDITSSGGQRTPLVRVASAVECGSAPAYYFGASANPRIVLCPNTCNLVRNEPGTRLDILVGCATRG